MRWSVLFHWMQQKKFESKIIDNTSYENMETLTHRARRSYSNDGCTAGFVRVHTARNVAIPAIHVCKPDSAVAWPASGLISQTIQNNLLRSAGRVFLPRVNAEPQRLILTISRTTVADKYNKPSQRNQDERLKPSLRLPPKEASAEPCLKFLGQLGFRLGSATIDPAWLSRCEPLSKAYSCNGVV